MDKRKCYNEFCEFSRTGEPVLCSTGLCIICDQELFHQWWKDPKRKPNIFKQFRSMPEAVRDHALCNIPPEYVDELSRYLGTDKKCENEFCVFSNKGGRMKCTTTELCVICDEDLARNWIENGSKGRLVQVICSMPELWIRDLAFQQLPQEHVAELRQLCLKSSNAKAEKLCPAVNLEDVD